MKKLTVLSVLLIIVSCQKRQKKENDLLDVSSFYPKEKTKVLVVGTFHFSYPNLDAVKTAKEDQIDVLKEPKKSELEALIAYIKRFKPTKIAVEALPNFKATERLRKYKKGEYRDRKDERFSLGMRIASDLQLDTLYAVDAGSFISDIEKIDSSFTNKLFKDFDFKSDDPLHKGFENWMIAEKKLKKEENLLDYFKYMNSKKYHEQDYGVYLTGDFKLSNHRGADIIASWWYSRNLRMFRNIQMINAEKDDRILVIIGNAHASILRQLFECSPEFDFVEFDGL